MRLGGNSISNNSARGQLDDLIESKRAYHQRRAHKMKAESNGRTINTINDNLGQELEEQETSNNVKNKKKSYSKHSHKHKNSNSRSHSHSHNHDHANSRRHKRG
jgi:hypothetical protein